MIQTNTNTFPKVSKLFTFGTTRAQHVPSSVLSKLWANTKLCKERTIEHEFYGRIRATPSCWLWTGPDGKDGLGKLDGRLVSWVAWYAANGPVPDWAGLKNTCGNPLCHNPGHMALVQDPQFKAFVKEYPEFSDTRWSFQDGSAEWPPVRIKPVHPVASKDPQPTKTKPTNIVPSKDKPAAKPVAKQPPKTTPIQVVPDGGALCRKGHDTTIMGWYIFEGGKRRECRACKIARSLTRQKRNVH